MPSLRVSGATVSYGQIVAVEDVSFEVFGGDFLCIVGSNGSGKTSLIRAILGVVPLAAGRVEFGVPRESVGYLPQTNSIPADIPATAREVAITGRRLAGGVLQFYSNKDRAAVEGTFERLGITGIANTRIGELSGGQKQRVLLARALVGEPELLVLDEPYGGLDEEAGNFLRVTLRELMKSGGFSVVMVSHDMREVSLSATKVAVMDRRLVFSGAASDWERFRAAK